MRSIFLFILLLAAFSSFSQPAKPFTGTNNIKSKTQFTEALKAYNMLNYKKAFDYLRSAIAGDPAYLDAYMLTADIHERNEQYEQALDVYKKVISINPEFQVPYFKLSQAALKTGNYDEALKNIEIYNQKGGSQVDRSKVAKVNATALFGSQAVKSPVPFNPVNLGPKVNTPADEYFPGVTADDQTLIFTRLERGSNEEFYISKKTPDGWGAAFNMGSPVNTDMNEGTVSLSADGQYIFYTGCNREDGEGSCDIYFSALDGDTWRDPNNLGFPVNTRSWESQPSLSFDFKTIYFSSNRAGGFGESDLWYSTYSKGKWGPPVNLGADINSPGSEQSPLIAKDDQTLYFISNYHPGMGGMDLFMSRRQPDGRWGKPENLGYPINTMNDEMCLALSANGKDAFIASERAEGQGGLDIYGFELYEKARPQKTGYVKGVVYDAKTKKKLKARLELIDLTTKKTIVEAASNRITGAFLFLLQGNKNYALNVSCEGYLFYSENFSLKDRKAEDPLFLDIPLNPIMPGEKVVLKNVFFDVDKFVLREESKVELDKLIAFMKANPTLKIELSGHTDNTGVKARNIELSNNRAKAVYEYLTANAIPAARLTFKGYGDAEPIGENKSEAGKQRNRRTEFKIISR